MMGTKLPFEASEGPVVVTQLEHESVNGVLYPPQLYYSYDFALPVGANVLSIADGTVISVVNNVPDGTELAPVNSGLDAIAYPQLGPGGTGNQITIYYDSIGLYVTYAHLAQGSIPFTQTEIDAGTATVSQGELIGEVGLTGTGTAPHLHVTYGTTTSGWGGSTSNVYPTTTITNGSIQGNPTGTELVFDESGGQPLSETTYQSQNSSIPSFEFPEGGVTETISFADAADDFGVADGSDVAELYLESVFGAAISNVTYTGSEDAAFLVSDFEIPGVNIDLEGGILLSSGGFPGSSNTSSGFSVSHGTGGDSDLDEVASTAFSGAGTTFDASILEFSIFIDNQDVDGIRFDIIFGSDEYPEFSNTSVIDVAAVFVNGDNKALFNGDPSTPLSVIDENLALNFVDNTSGTYPIEWDGFGALSVRPELNQGWNTIKIAVADTGDSVYDSSIYVTNFELLSDGATGDGIFKVVNGAVGLNDLAASESKEEFNLAEGSGSVSGTLKELTGDVVTGFTDQIKLIIEQVNLLKERITITYGSAILDIDEDGDGDVDGTITLEGDFEGAEFNIDVVGENTEITVEFPPVNSPPVAIDDVLNVDEDQTLTGNVLVDNGNGADIDPDGDNLTVSLISGPAEGILNLNGDGSFSYEADADVFDLAAPGDVIEQSFTYQIDDGNGEIDQATATISVTILDDGETISSKNGKDDVFGTDGGEDILEGGNGKDRLFGLDGADHLYGGNGKDLLDGGEGPDKLYGGNGKDTLIGGFGNDELTGGKGDDTFVFALGLGTDTVLDCGVGDDLIGLDGLIFADISISQAGDDAALSANGELLAVLIGVDAASLSESDFFGFV